MTASTVQRLLRQTKAFDSPEQEVYLALQIAAQRLTEPWAKHLKEQGRITANQYNVLRILRGAGRREMTCSEIAARMISHDPDITRLTDRLTREGLVERRRDDGDRRVVRVRITAKGRALLRKLDPAAKRFPKTLLGPMGASKLAGLRALLNELLEHDSARD